ncbi:MAG: C25 family cysteine peptidase [Planctomycetota bacterium]
MGIRGLLLVILCFVGSAAARAEKARTILLVPVGEQPSWRDDAYLAAIAASMQICDGIPVALAVDAEAPWRPELVDFLARYEPERCIWVGDREPDAIPPVAKGWQWLECRDAFTAQTELARLAWTACKRVVLYDDADPGAALLAAGLAGRLSVPLLAFPSEKGPADRLQVLGPLAVRRALYIGGGSPPAVLGLRVQTLRNGEEVAAWMRREREAVPYLVAVNSREEVAGRANHLAMVAPLLAAAHQGLVVDLPYETRWKQRFAAEEWSADPPAGAAQGAQRLGSLDGQSFVIGKDPADGQFFAQVDGNGDGRFDGEGEGPLKTGASVRLGDRLCALDLDAEDKQRGQALWLCFPAAETVRERLDRHRKTAGDAVQTLCLVGWPTAVPMAVISNGQGIDTDLVSDLPYGQTDEDAFLELGLARFLAEDLPSATLQACRGLVRDRFPDQKWRGRFATAEWGAPLRLPFEAQGWTYAGHHDGPAGIGAPSPLTGCEVLLHASHASWLGMGATYPWNSETLLAPAIVQSSGCSTASLDQDGERRSVAARLLRNGAVAFVGNARRGIAQQRLYESELWNAIAEGANLGQAHRAASNGVLVAVLERGEQRGGSYFYQLGHQSAYGDPALTFAAPGRPQQTGAHVARTGPRVEVLAPEEWQRIPFAPVSDWKCAFETLYVWNAPGCVYERSWFGPEKRDAEIPLVHVQLDVHDPDAGIEMPEEVAAPLGWNGKWFVDSHDSGGATLHLRVRLFDGDQTGGAVRSELPKLRLRLTGR